MRKKRGFRRRLWSAALGALALMTATGSVSGFAVFARAEQEASAWLEWDPSGKNGEWTDENRAAGAEVNEQDASLRTNENCAAETEAVGQDASPKAYANSSSESTLSASDVSLWTDADFAQNPAETPEAAAVSNPDAAADASANAETALQT